MRTYLVGGGIGSLAAAAFLIRDAGVLGDDISVLERDAVLGGSLDGAGDPTRGYSLRGGRMFTTDNYECTWDLFKSIPLWTIPPSQSSRKRWPSNERHPAHSLARLVDRRRARVPVTSMGFSMQDRLELLKLSRTNEAVLGSSRITDWFSPSFFETRSGSCGQRRSPFNRGTARSSLKRYLHRFMMESRASRRSAA